MATSPGGTPNAVRDLSDDTGAGSDATVTTFTRAPGLTVTKTVNESALSNGAQAGDVLVYTITARNSGNVTLDNVSLTDSLTAVGGSAQSLTPVFVSSTGTGGAADTGIASDALNVGETWTWTVSYALKQSDIDAGGVSNLATVTAEDPNNTPVTVESKTGGNTTAGAGNGAGTVTTFTRAPSLQLVKTALLSGDVITYSYAVRNTGNVTLADVSVAELLTSTDVTTYGLGGTPFSGTGTAPVFAGTMTLTDVSPSSDSSNAGSDLVYDTLGVGDTVTWTASYTLTQADKDAGGVSNQAVGLATSPGGTPNAVRDLSDDAGAGSDATVTAFARTSGLSLVKSVNTTFDVTGKSRIASGAIVDMDGDGMVSAGDRVYYDLVVANTGNVTVRNIGLTDASADVVSASLISSLAPGASDSATFAAGAYIFLMQADIDAGFVSNSAVATGDSPSGTDDVSDTSGTAGNNDTATTLTLSQTTLLKVTKTVDDSALDDGVRPGDRLDYTIRVENIGNVTLSSVTLTDTIRDNDGVELALDSNPQKVSDSG